MALHRGDGAVARQRGARPAHAAGPAARHRRTRPAVRKSPSNQREALATCLEESERILSMLNTLMDISEAETGVVQLKREPVALRAAARGSGRALRGRRGREDGHRDARDRARTSPSAAPATDCARCSPTCSTTPSSTRRRRRCRFAWRVAREAATRSCTVSDTGRRHRRRTPAADLGAPLPRRPQPFRARPGARPEPGQGLRPSARRHGRGHQRARPWLDLHRPTAASPGCTLITRINTDSAPIPDPLRSPTFHRCNASVSGQARLAIVLQTEVICNHD